VAQVAKELLLVEGRLHLLTLLVGCGLAFIELSLRSGKNLLLLLDTIDYTSIDAISQ
jgi:hypothetical protein